MGGGLWHDVEPTVAVGAAEDIASRAGQFRIERIGRTAINLLTAADLSIVLDDHIDEPEP